MATYGMTKNGTGSKPEAYREGYVNGSLCRELAEVGDGTPTDGDWENAAPDWMVGSPELTAEFVRGSWDGYNGVKN